MTSERAVLLIADIGGYTEYMSTHRMNLAHAEVGTTRMLESIVDAARGFDLVEIEGDAAFLSRRDGGGDSDAAVEGLLSVVVAMHRAFHREREDVATNLCPCGGCREVGNLKLKFVAHVGDVAVQSIRGRRKLVGIDVILVHRLLKNPVAIPEYVLFSEDLFATGRAVLPENVHEISPDLEGIGQVRAYFVDVADIDDPLPPLRSPAWYRRLGNTFAIVGRGLPHMLGRRPAGAVPESA